MSAPADVISLDDFRPATLERLRFVAGLVAWGLAGDSDRAREALLAVKALATHCWEDIEPDPEEKGR